MLSGGCLTESVNYSILHVCCSLYPSLEDSHSISSHRLLGARAVLKLDGSLQMVMR